ncbi:MAG: hypothetical protein CME68_03925 [Halobacteriovoraceae bacterium]|nr:hypothetical protein [Halobacteriovoraceae bacterium]
MATKKNIPERRRVLGKEALMLQFNETLKSLYPDKKAEQKDLFLELDSLLNDIYPELENNLVNNKKFFGGMPTDWSASSLFDYYLKRREPLPQHCNYGFVLSDFLPNTFNPLLKAATFVLNLYKFLKEKREGHFSCTPTKWGMVDNTVYKKFIHLTRRPGISRDSVVYNSWVDVQSIIVIYNGHYFKVPLYDKRKDHIYNAEELTNAFSKIVHAKKDKKNHFPLGVMTSLNRDKWGRYQSSFRELEGFSGFLDEIEKSLFVLSLDLEEVPSSKTDKVRIAIDGPPENRWYDKSLNLSVSKKGTISVNCDHLIMDGSPFLEMINSAFEASEACKSIQSKSEVIGKNEVPFYELVSPNITKIIPKKDQNDIGDDIKREKNEISCSHHVLPIGMELLNKLKLRPDMSFQLFIQMASLMTFKSILPTSQAVEMRTFEYGRYDTILSNSNYIKKLMKLFEIANDMESAKPFMSLFRAMVENQKNKIVSCKKGEALITYLDALLALDLPLENPKRKSLERFKLLFETNLMLKGLMDPYISTSGIPSLKSIDTFAFTDFGKEKLGLGYIIGPKEVILGEYRLGTFKKKKDNFINNLKDLINKFIFLYEGNDPEFKNRSILDHGTELLKEAR